MPSASSQGADSEQAEEGRDGGLEGRRGTVCQRQRGKGPLKRARGWCRGREWKAEGLVWKPSLNSWEGRRRFGQWLLIGRLDFAVTALILRNFSTITTRKFHVDTILFNPSLFNFGQLSNSGPHTAFSCTLVCFNLKLFPQSLFFMTLTFLKRTGHLFCRTLLRLGLSNVSSWLFSGDAVWAEIHRRYVICVFISSGTWCRFVLLLVM